MEAYRDQYATMFNNGRNVVVIAMSDDADTTLANWAHDSDFPFLMASDSGRATAHRYGSMQGNRPLRNVFVIGPDGRVAHRIIRFNVLSQDAYAELEKAVDQTTGGPGPR